MTLIFVRSVPRLTQRYRWSGCGQTGKGCWPGSTSILWKPAVGSHLCGKEQNRVWSFDEMVPTETNFRFDLVTSSLFWLSLVRSMWYHVKKKKKPTLTNLNRSRNTKVLKKLWSDYRIFQRLCNFSGKLALTLHTERNSSSEMAIGPFVLCHLLLYSLATSSSARQQS